MTTPRRDGFTLLEVLLVMTVLVILAAWIGPTLSGLRGNLYQKGAADRLRGRIADARTMAMKEGTPHRLAVSSDGTRVRLAPDTLDFANIQAGADAGPTAKAIEQPFERATVAVVGGGAEADAGDGWVTVATFLADGTCREDNVTVEVREEPFPPIRLHLRGVTGYARVLPANDPKAAAPGGTP